MPKGGKTKYLSGELCHMPGCNKPIHARGVCSAHYMQVRRQKDSEQLAELQRLSPQIIDEGCGVVVGKYASHATDVALSILAKTAPVNLCEYIQREITLPPGHGYRGSRKMNFDMYPHQRFILELVDNPDVKRIVLCLAAQSGKSDLMAAISSYLTGYRGKNGMYVLPSERMAKKVPNTRLEPLMANSNVGFVGTENSNSIFRFTNGCFFSIGLASSPASLAEQTATQWVMFDELDEYYPARHDCVSLGEKRMQTAPRALTIIGCTPKRTEVGYTYSYYEQSRFYVEEIQCPFCENWFEPDFDACFRWPEGADARLIEFERLGWVECPHHGCRITDDMHFDIVTKRKRWHCEAPHLPMVEVGVRVPIFMTPVKNWSDACAAFVKSENDPLARDDFYNSWCAKPQRKTNLRDPALVQYKELQGSWSQETLEIPADVLFVTAGIDVGDAELWLLLLGWGVGDRKYVLRTERIPRAQGWDGWDDAMERATDFCDLAQFRTLGNFSPTFEGGIIDSGDGDDAELVYTFCRLNPLWKPAKGYGAQKRLFERSEADPRNKFRGRYRGLELIVHATHMLQDILHTSLQTGKGKNGSVQFAADAPALLFTHIKNQVRVPVTVKGAETYEWRKVGTRPDHFRDALMGAILCGRVLGLHELALLDPAPNLPVVDSATPLATVASTSHWSGYDIDYSDPYTGRL